ncbi:MAG: ABC transporter ATP-binding protein [Deltaproteobacteria bacterium]|jgi:peptide/nickel transport system ATP-binding protein|nr:ABC transporter ATP-binding protein [Deltaproteobacteria bacterium]
MKLLEIKNLYVTIDTLDGPLQIIKGIDFSIEKGERLGIVGESGCGKSITSLAIMALLPHKSKVTGQILLNGEDINLFNEEQMCRIRGNKIGMIFQEPMTALNPVKTIGAQIAESLILHRNMKKRQRIYEVEQLLESVDLPVERFGLNLYPHQLSGGQRQRVMIAMAIACKPDILIADEPTTALDVTVQKQILELIKELAMKFGMSLIMISHDLGVIAQTTQKVMIMYAGEVMEQGETSKVFKHMSHPYTQGLFAAIPKPGSSRLEGKKRLSTIPGSVPDPTSTLQGCIFEPRCRFSDDICLKSEPEKSDISPGHHVRCFHPVVKD